MDQQDLELIQRHKEENKKLEALYAEHLDFERQLEKFNSKPYLTPMEEVERKTLQKRKLQGKDLIESILQQYRKQESLS